MTIDLPAHYVYHATSGEISKVDEDEFIDDTEITRADYLNGDDPQELALIKALRRTFTMWEQEFARQAAGEPPTNTYTSKTTKPGGE
jgi:hypothetical protein